MKRKAPLFVLGGLVAAVTLWWALKPPPPPSPVPAAIKVGFIPIAECAHLYVAKANGYFQDEKLNVELVQMTGGQHIIPAVSSGALDIGFTNIVSFLIATSKRAEASPNALVSVAGASYEEGENLNHGLLTLHSRGLREQDMIRPGLKFAINTTGNIEELMLREYLQGRGLSSAGQNALTIRQLPFGQMLQALRRGEIDVAAEVEPFITPPTNRGEFDLVARHYQRIGPKLPVATYVATRGWMKDNDVALRAFQRAFGRAANFIQASPEQAKAAIAQFTNLSPEEMQSIRLPLFRPCLIPNDLEVLVNGMRAFNFVDQGFATPRAVVECRE